MVSNKEKKMKEYVTPDILLWEFVGMKDIITASNPNDNDFSDIEDWDA